MDDFFAENVDGADDNLAPDRFRSSTSSKKVSFGGTSPNKNQTGSTKHSKADRSANRPRLPDEVGRLPELPDFSNFKCSDIVGLVQFGLEFITRNGQTTYKAPIPPTSDINELEYISALHQCSSMDELRMDCSIHADEIGHFLKSRYGICVTPEIVRTIILQDGLTADKDERHANDDAGGGVMDLVELTSALIIPNLLRLRRKRMDEKQISVASGKAKHMLASIASISPRKASIDFRGTAKLAVEVDMLKDVLSLMLEDCTGDASPKALDENLVRDILCGYGEGALAQDIDLVRQMVEVAAGGSLSGPLEALEEGGPVAMFDLDAFVAALTSDVARKYDPGREERRSTNFDDVWFHSAHLEGDSMSAENRLNLRDFREDNGNAVEAHISQLREETLSDTLQWCKRRDTKKREREDPQDAEAANDGSESEKMTVRRLFAGQPIDYTVDTYRTRLQIVVLWIAFVLFYVSYLYFGTGGYKAEQCSEASLSASVACPLIGGIVNQLLMIAELIVFGAPFIVLGSIGNAIEGHETITRMLVCLALFLAYNIIFYAVGFSVPLWVSSPHPSKATSINKTALGTAFIVSSMHIWHTLMLLLKNYKPRWRFSQSRFFKWYFLSANVKYEAKIKRSALFKVDCMLSNAYDVHREVIRYKERQRTSSNNDSSFLSNFGMAVTEFSKRDGLTAYVGGVGLTWKRIWNGSLFTEDGIWFSVRLMAGTVFQIIVIFLLPIVCLTALPILLDELRKQLEQGGNEEEDIDAIEFQTKVAITVGITFAFIVSIFSTFLYLPSVVATTMKFRRGVLATLRSENFLHRYRFALDQTTLMYGGMFWGTLVSSLAIGSLAGGLIFLLMLPATQMFLFGIIGNLFGLVIILVVKIIIMQVIRFSHYAAFYRMKPLSANIVNICLECYAIGISIWFMLVRTIKIVVISALYLGRTDTPLFASGVGIFGPLEIDNWPTVTRKEILIHEAHRHPYIETLGYLYMMQLRYRDGGFAKRACSAWRLVFCLAFMPWLHKYRDSTRPEHFGKAKKSRSDDFSSLEIQEDVIMDLISLSDTSNGTGPGANRLMRQTMVASRWHDSTGTTLTDKTDESEENTRIANLRREIARLNAELTSAIEESAAGKAEISALNRRSSH